MQILVFGKSGQVANALGRQPVRHRITCLGRPEADIGDRAKIADAMARHKPDLVVNAAAYTAVDKAESDSDAAFAINRDGAENLALASATAGVPLVHLSTDYVFSGEKPTPYLPADETGPQGVYGKSKLAGEEKVAGACARHIIIRTAWVYDVSGSNFPKTMLRLAADRDELTVVADQFGNPTDAGEIARAIMAVADTLEQDPAFEGWGIYHFAGPERFNWSGFARLILDVSRKMGGPHARVRDITTEEYPTAAVRPANSLLDSHGFAGAFGYTSQPVAASIETAMPHWLDAGV